MTKADKIKELCKDKGITVKKLEQDLGYSNGSLMKRDGNGIKHNRIVEISNYFQISTNYFYEDEQLINDLYGEDAPEIALNESKKRYIFDQQDKILDLFFYNDEFRDFLSNTKWADELGLGKKQNSNCSKEA